MFELVKPGTHIDFIGRWKIAAVVSLAVIAAGIAGIVTQGFRLGIDFAGGTEVQVRFAPGVAVDEGAVRNVVTACGVVEPSVVRYGDGESEFLIRFGRTAPEGEIDAALESATTPAAESCESPKARETAKPPARGNRRHTRAGPAWPCKPRAGSTTPPARETRAASSGSSRIERTNRLSVSP